MKAQGCVESQELAGTCGWDHMYQNITAQHPQSAACSLDHVNQETLRQEHLKIGMNAPASQPWDIFDVVADREPHFRFQPPTTSSFWPALEVRLSCPAWATQYKQRSWTPKHVWSLWQQDPGISFLCSCP